MQHDHVLKRVHFDQFTHIFMVGGGSSAKNLLPCCRICDSLQFDMQHDHVLNKLNFDLLTPTTGSGGWMGLRAKYLPHAAAFVIPFNVICNMTVF